MPMYISVFGSLFDLEKGQYEGQPASLHEELIIVTLSCCVVLA